MLLILPTCAFAATDAAAPPSDIGLAQQLRQQLRSECFGFVEHDPQEIRGYAVDATRQLLRDGYPWARFEDLAPLLVDRAEVLVGGPAQRCALTPPGGLVNDVTRRPTQDARPSGRIEHDSHGSVALRAETPLLRDTDRGALLAANLSRARTAAGSIDSAGSIEFNGNWQMRPSTRLRLDLQAGRLQGSGVPRVGVAGQLPPQFDRRIDLSQPGADYHADVDSSLLAIEHSDAAGGEWRLGWSRVRDRSDYHDLFLTPRDDDAASTRYTLTDTVYPAQRSRFDAGLIERRWSTRGGPVAHRLRAALSRIDVTLPDELRPVQTLGDGSFAAPQQFAAASALPASAVRELRSTETRASLQDTLAWREWELVLGLEHALFGDDNGSARRRDTRWSPVASLSWHPTEALTLMATEGRAANGRQFASLAAPDARRIAPAVSGDESELGLRWQTGPTRLGAGVFQASRPYRFEQQAVSVWRGQQRHRGVELSAQVAAEDERWEFVATAQSLRARVTGTGEPALEGREPPGVAPLRGSLYGHWRWTPSWSASSSLQAQARRAAFDDNRVFAPGYARLDVGLEWEGRAGDNAMTLDLALENAGNRYAFDTGRGSVSPIAPRTVRLTLVLGGSV